MSQAENTIVIAGAARTPVGSFNGSLANVPAHELGSTAIKAALERASVESKLSFMAAGVVTTALIYRFAVS